MTSSTSSASAAATATATPPAASSPSANEYFTAGSVVSLKTCLHKEEQTLEGTVLAFDPVIRTMLLKTTSSCKRPSLNDVHMVNLNFVSEVKVITEVPAAEANSSPTAALNIQRLNNRAMNNVEKKRRFIRAFKQGVSPEGQKLFQFISKTLEEIDWEGDNISVMRKVTITPPYRPENVKGVQDSKAVMHVKKIVERFFDEYSNSGGGSGGGGSPSPSSSSSTSTASLGNKKASPVSSSSSQKDSPQRTVSSATNKSSSKPDKVKEKPVTNPKPL